MKEAIKLNNSANSPKFSSHLIIVLVCHVALVWRLPGHRHTQDSLAFPKAFRLVFEISRRLTTQKSIPSQLQLREAGAFQGNAYFLPVLSRSIREGLKRPRASVGTSAKSVNSKAAVMILTGPIVAVVHLLVIRGAEREGYTMR